MGLVISQDMLLRHLTGQPGCLSMSPPRCVSCWVMAGRFSRFSRGLLKINLLGRQRRSDCHCTHLAYAGRRYEGLTLRSMVPHECCLSGMEFVEVTERDFPDGAASL